MQETNKISYELYNLNKLERIGAGSDREVYLIDKNKVIKVAKTMRGLAQIDNANDSFISLIPEIYEQGLDYIIVEYIPRNDKKLRQILKPFKKFEVMDWEHKKTELLELFEKYEAKFVGFSDFINYNLLWYDFISFRNWGYKKGKPILLDTGTLNKDILDKDNVKNVYFEEWEKIKDLRRQIKKNVK